MEAPDYIIWHIDESEDELLSSLEHPEYFADKVAKLKPGSARMLEVLAVRRALKELCYGQEQQVLYTAEGAPYLDRRIYGSDQVPAVSISHTKDYAAVILAEAPVGIDIERRGERVQRVVSHFLTSDELVYLELSASMHPDLSADEALSLALHLAWSAKEAAFKVLGRDYYDLQHLTGIQHIDWQLRTLSLRVQGRELPLLVHFDYTDDYVLGWVLENDPHS